MRIPTVVYLAGLGRSGTTLLERVLAEVPGVAPAGELVHLWHRGLELDERCGCGERFSDCPFWTAVGDQAFGGWDRLDVARVEQLQQRVDRSKRIPAVVARGWLPGTAALVEEYARYYLRIYAGIQATTGCDVVVDSSKHPSLAYVLSTMPEIDLRVIHVVRDPRAAAYSWTKRVRRPEATGAGDEEMYVYTPGHTAQLWNSHNVTLQALPLTGTPRLLLRYEDFLGAPRETLQRIVAWAGLPADAPLPISADGVATLTPAHTVSGNPVRFATGDVPIVAQDEWQTRLSPRDQRVVTALTLPLLHKFGYPARTAGVASHG